MDQLLKEAGYYNGREVDITEILEMYMEHGYIYTDKQIEFLKAYAYLKIEYIHPIWKDEKVFMDIDPIKAQKPIDISWIQKYNAYLDDELLIIGEIKAEEMTLYLSKKGYFFGCFDDCIINWGDDFEKMLFFLVRGERGEYMEMD
ncbi:MAG: SUKH-3 domain-containing protein [Clostridium sp.]|nr:SUKH-3 domain-containing protein [Clostridium sp.]